MSTFSTPVAAFCSHGGDHLSFLSSSKCLEKDVDTLLKEFGASEEVRQRVYEALQTRELPFDSGFRFEEELPDVGRTVVYATIPMACLDAHKLTVQEELDRRVNAKESSAHKGNGPSAERWRSTAA